MVYFEDTGIKYKLYQRAKTKRTYEDGVKYWL